MSLPVPVRRARTLALALVVASTCAALDAGAAHAATSATCSGEESGTFSPALTNTAQTVTYSLSESLACTSSTHPSITSGTASLSAAVPLSSCLSVALGGPRTRTIAWNTGETSTITFVAVATAGPGNALDLTRTGVVTAGKFLGALTVGSLATTFDFGLCSGAGVPDYEGTTELSITGVL